MTKDDVLRFATMTIDRAANKPKREEDLYTPTLPKRPKGAEKVGFDYNYYSRALNSITITLRATTFNLLPILYSLGMASKEYLVKYRGLVGDELKRAIKADYISLGGLPGLFDSIIETDKYRKCLGSAAAPDREFWPYIDLDYVGEDAEKYYPCPLFFRLRGNEMVPKFEIWVSGELLEKRKEQERIAEELNKFFEKGANPGLLMKYFGHFKEGKIVPNEFTDLNKEFLDVTRK